MKKTSFYLSHTYKILYIFCYLCILYFKLNSLYQNGYNYHLPPQAPVNFHLLYVDLLMLICINSFLKLPTLFSKQ